MTRRHNPANEVGSPIHASGAVAATVLVLSADESALGIIQGAAEPFAIGLYISNDPVAVFNLLNRRKFEAVIVDLEAGEGSDVALRAVHFSPANRTAVTFVIAPEHPAWRSSAQEAAFVLERPLSHDQVFNMFRAAYGMIIRERRRYFRYPVSIGALARIAGPRQVQCNLVNVSEGGVAIISSALFQDEPLALEFELPGSAGKISAETRVCWRRSKSEIGLEFVSIPMKADLQEWLGARLDEVLPERVGRLFKTASGGSRNESGS
jgi:hypothetical protein